ncbi:MAG: hypothetical protein SH850_21235 [Planctomycetaceae bacterium]|nr:hypothetical protein [Planctomycetaceae bacterium]
MMAQKKTLPDGCYPCSATLHIVGGKVVVELHSTFGLKPGTKLPLKRPDGNLVIEEVNSLQVEFFNGHAII